MARPQQPELARSAKTDLDPDHIETGLQGQKAPATGGETGPVPPGNQPGHHPGKEQDKPDLDAFAAKLGADPKAPSATSARKPPRPKAPAKPAVDKAAGSKPAPAKSAPAKSGPATSPPATSAPATSRAAKSAPATSRAGSRVVTAAPNQSPDAPSPDASDPAGSAAARRRGGAPGWPESAPAKEGVGPLAEPSPAQEPIMVSWALLPLRETVKQLERLERRLTERLTGR